MVRLARLVVASARAVAPAWALAIVAVWATIRTLHAPATVPDDAAWQQAATYVRSQFRPGDLIVFAPPWIDPVGRTQLGDLIPLAAAGRLDAAHYPTIWHVAIRNAVHPDVAQLVAASSPGPQSFAGVVVTRFDQPAITITADAATLLSTATVTGAIARGATVELTEVGFTPHRCVQVVPQPNGSIRVTFPAFTLGTQLVVGVGLADVFTRRDSRSPGKLSVEIAGAVVASAQFGVNDGWVKMQASTTPGTAEVSFVATAVGATSRDRLICFAAQARR
ncbi:MAG: hypothetical protein KBG15_08630 [Kofleriaceae bacterium]|nr:hypothetical protein [Kofleriaceae bacterium]